MNLKKEASFLRLNTTVFCRLPSGTQPSGIVAVGPFASLAVCKAEQIFCVVSSSPSDRSFLITYLVLLQTSTWRQTSCPPLPLEFCCKLSLGSHDNLEFSQWASLRFPALYLEPSTAGSGVTAIIQEVWKEFKSTQGHLIFGRYAGVSQDAFIWKSFLSCHSASRDCKNSKNWWIVFLLWSTFV